MKILSGLLLALFIATTTACAIQPGGKTLGGKTVAESFSDPRVVELTDAAMSGDTDTVIRLAKAGVPVNAVGYDSATPLIWALYVNNLTGMEALLKAGADPNQKTIGGVSAFAWASGSNKPGQFDLLLRYGGNPNADDTGKIEDRPLSRAAAQGRLNLVKKLIAAGADVNAHDDHDNSAADQASAMGNFDIVAYLLEHGYTFKLQSLGRGVEIREVPPDSESQHWKDKVIVMLKERGVKLPAFIPCYSPYDPRYKAENCKSQR